MPRRVAATLGRRFPLGVQAGRDEVGQFLHDFGQLEHPRVGVDLVEQPPVRHAVLDWMAANVLVEQDAAGNLKPSEAKSSERIDGVVALVRGTEVGVPVDACELSRAAIQ